MKIEKRPIVANRIRQIQGSSAFIEHKFLRHGFWTTLDHRELLLYIFLIMVADRQGLSYYSYDKICTILRITVDQYITARNGLIEKDLITLTDRADRQGTVIPGSFASALSEQKTGNLAAMVPNQNLQAVRTYAE